MASTEQKEVTQPDNNKNDNKVPTKFRYNFIYKALTLILFLVILPISPSQAPEFINNQELFTRTWELLHHLFVGIAISYGLFSRKNDDNAEPDNKEPQKDLKYKNYDEPYVSRFLHVSPDDPERPFEDDNNSKVQTWSSRYHRSDDAVVVVVAEESSVLGGLEKPLLLPVRSLKETLNSSAVSEVIVPSESSTSGVVLPCPIPWRSRSVTFETKAETSKPSLRSQSLRFSRPESQAKTSEDFLRKTNNRSFYSKSGPPTPPPPPVFYSSKPSFPSWSRMSSSSSSEKEGKIVRRSLKVPEESKQRDFAVESNPEEMESEEDGFVDQRETDGKGGGKNSEGAEGISSVSGDVGPDVDRKADEFIAKFREQIRLQRIESIKRSTAQISKKLSR